MLMLTLLCSGVSNAAQATEEQKLGAALATAYEAKDWKKSIEISHKLVELNPRGGTHQYNLGCCYALNGEKDKALEWVEKAADAGFSDDMLMAGDADFASIREDERFKKQLARVRENGNKRAAELQARAAGAVLEIYVPDTLERTKPAPLIIALHGYGGTAKEMADVWKGVAAENGAILIAPQGMDAAGEGWSWENMRSAEFIVLAAMEKIGKAHKIDEKRVVLSGFSQGGFAAYSIGFKHPTRFRGVVPVAAVYNGSLAPKPGAGKEGYPKFVIMVGSRDRVLAENKKAASDLEAAGISHKLNVYDGVGHTFPQDRDGELRKALRYIFE